MATDKHERDTSASNYWENVEQIAKDVQQAAHDGQDEGDRLHEEIDGSWWIIYNHASRAVMEHTENDDAIFDELGKDAVDGKGSFQEIVTACAFYAMRADVQDRMGRLDPIEDEEEDEIEEDE